MQRIAIYDMDKTITRKATFGPFLAYAAPRHRPWRIILAPALLLNLLGYALGIIDRARLKELNLALMLGRRIDQAALRRLSARFAGRTLARNAAAAALDRMDSDRADGFRIVIASASYDFYVDQIGRLLGAETIATRATDDNGTVSPRIDGQNCYGAAKLEMVRGWLKRQSLRREGLHIRFYSDHVSDAPSFDWADEAFAINPHPPLRRLAAQRGWAVLDWT